MCKKSYNNLFFVTLFLSVIVLVSAEDQNVKTADTIDHDLTDTFKINESTYGVQKVNLKCGSNSMHVQLETEKDFNGVMYTRGSFYKQAEPCFVKPKNGRSRSLEMQFTLDQCQTQQEGDVYSNVVIIQNDPELVTPGDSAFSLECDFRKPRSIDVGADMQARERTVYGSRIILTSPDPSSPLPNVNDNPEMAFNTSDTVTFIPSKRDHHNHHRVIEQRIEGSVEMVPIDNLEETYQANRQIRQFPVMKLQNHKLQQQ